MRSLSIDPVVVRQNWLKAYDFVTDRAAVTLNEYARDNDPFAKVGRETVAVEVASVVRASDTSFQVRWLERIFEGGALKDTKRLTGLFSIVITPPRTVEAGAQEPARHLRAHLQLVAGRQRGRAEMSRSRWMASASVLTLVARRLRDARAGAGDPDPRQPRLQGGQARAGAEASGGIHRGAETAAAAGPAEAGRRRAAEKQKDERTPKDRVIGANAAARIEPVKDGYINAIQVYPYTKGALYQLYAAVNQVTDIALEAGEKLVSVSAGDTVRWVVGDTTSGEGKDAQVHILVKPIGADLETNLVITTDRRTYHLEMRSSPVDLHGVGVVDLSGLRAAGAQEAARARPKLRPRRWPTPASTSSSCGSAIASRATRPGSRASVFDDGAKVYIQFPSGLAQSEAPPLFVIGPDGKPALVNYRVRGTTYIVDRLFAAAELRLGTAPQRVVRIVRTDAVWREMQQ